MSKTSIAARMRAWMKTQNKPFTKRNICVGLAIDDPAQCATIISSVPNFVKRGEIFLLPHDKRIRRQDRNHYRYNRAWKNVQKGKLRPKICKAIYLSGVNGSFAVTDIQRLTDLKRDWIDRIVNRLRESGHLTVVGRRICSSSHAGAENLYHITNRDKFRLEVLR